MKIGIYIVNKVAKANYKKECFDTRKNAGILIVSDIIRRMGYEVDYCSSANVHTFDIVLVAITSDCDWWPFIAERAVWRKGNYKVIAGGAGVLNIRPLLPFVDYFVLGRAEGVIDKLIAGLANHGEYEGPSVVNSKTFSTDQRYIINQVSEPYPYMINLSDGTAYQEDMIGCNHRCLFCGYTWQRHHSGGVFNVKGIWKKQGNERAILDWADGASSELSKLRITAIDGMSERLRFMVDKKITRKTLKAFLAAWIDASKPQQLKIYNILGYPTETQDDYYEFLEDMREVDSRFSSKQDKQWSICLHNTPFRAMPASPLACQPMSYENYRGLIGNTLGKGLKGNLFYQGNGLWAVESMGTDSLSTHALSAIIHRGTEDDSDTVRKIACSKAFWRANGATRQATLEKYFDMNKYFRGYKLDELPTAYLETYADYKKMIKIRGLEG